MKRCATFQTNPCVWWLDLDCMFNFVMMNTHHFFTTIIFVYTYININPAWCRDHMPFPYSYMYAWVLTRDIPLINPIVFQTINLSLSFASIHQFRIHLNHHVCCLNHPFCCGGHVVFDCMCFYMSIYIYILIFSHYYFTYITII